MRRFKTIILYFKRSEKKNLPNKFKTLPPQKGTAANNAPDGTGIGAGKMSEMKEKMHLGELYLPGDPDIIKEQVIYQDKICEYNLTKPSETAKRAEMLKDMLGDCGEGVSIEAPFYANFGGHHCHFGKMVYANYHLTCVDDTHIYIGDYTMLGPNVTIATAGHPILPALREQTYQYNLPVHIGRNCWIGAGAIILPGVTIGDNTVIGAGSIVTKDIPANVVAVGNPCRVLREINEQDMPAAAGPTNGRG